MFGEHPIYKEVVEKRASESGEYTVAFNGKEIVCRNLTVDFPKVTMQEKRHPVLRRSIYLPERTWGWVKLLTIAQLQAICDDRRVDGDIDRTCPHGGKGQLAARVEEWLKRHQEVPALRDLCCAPAKPPSPAKRAGTQRKKRTEIEPGTDGAADARPSKRPTRSASADAAAAPAASTRRVPGAPRSHAIVPQNAAAGGR